MEQPKATTVHHHSTHLTPVSPTTDTTDTGRKEVRLDHHSRRYPYPFSPLHPPLPSNTSPVTWAQRSSATDAERNYIYLTISVPDVDPSKIKLDIQPTSLTFSGYSQTKKADYAVTLAFYDEIDPAASKTNHSPRDVEVKLQKKEKKEEFWPRLLKDKARMHFLKTDFDKVGFPPLLSSLFTP